MNNILELVMIVKNSGEILRKVLESIKPYLSYWTILDTGSTDGTQKLILDVMSDKPGKLFEEPFVNFLETRNRSLDLSPKKCKYQIILDDSYVLYGGKELCEFLKNTTNECFSIVVSDEDEVYPSNRIIKTSENLRYLKYKIHEFIQSSNVKPVPDICYIKDESCSVHKKRSYSRYHSDLNILLEQHKEYPTDSRILFYLAMTSLVLHKKNDAYKYYKKLIKHDFSKSDERYDASLYVAHYEYTELNVPWNKIEKKLFELVKEFPSRIEAIFLLFMYEYMNNNIERSFKYINICYKNIPKSVSFKHNIYMYKICIPYFYIDIHIKIGMIPEAVKELKRVISEFPENQSFQNIKYAITARKYKDSIILSDNKTVVIHTGGDVLGKPWNASNITQLGSGSEIMALNISNKLAEKGYKVFLFGSFKNETVDYTGVFDGVVYMNYTEFNDFAQRYIIDCLVISRFSDNLVYYDSIKKVYLWLHDIIPHSQQYTFQTHRDKFKGILCLSEWQIKQNKKIYNIPDELFKITSNAISLDRFDKKVEKEPFRFIWTSSVDRGIDYCIELMIDIHKLYPQSVLYIYGNIDFIFNKETLNKIDENKDFIILKPRISQDQLATELLKSDVWLYPNNFEETYCISAVEAAAAKCLICTNVHAGLERTVGTRGAIIKGEYNKDRLLSELCKVFNDKILKERLLHDGRKFAETQTYDILIDEWIKLI